MENENREIAIRLSGVKKMYRLGQIGGGTLRADLQSWWARKRGKTDPNTKIGQEERLVGETFMALNGIDLTVYKGEALGIIGGNGAGKSTLLKLLSQVTAPTDGQIELWGRVASMLEVGTGFNGEMTGRENIYMNGAILGMTKAEIDAKMEDIIEFSEVRDFIDTPVKRYSSGMYVKLAFSVAAHLDSEIMIMDEVLAVGDMAFQKKCLDKMRDVAKKEGRTVLYVSHNMNTIQQLCDRCVVLDKGKKVFEGEVEDAISLYLSNEKADMANEIQLQTGNLSDCEMQVFRFNGKTNAILSVNENIHFTLAVLSASDYTDVHLRAIVYSFDGLPVFMTSSDGFPIYSKKQTITGIIKTDNLASGDYRLKLALYQTNGYGAEQLLDMVNSQIFFHVHNEAAANGREWASQWWGHINQGRLEIDTID